MSGSSGREERDLPIRAVQGHQRYSPICRVLRRKPRTAPDRASSLFLPLPGRQLRGERKSWSGLPTLWQVGCVSDISPFAMETGGGGGRGIGRTVQRKLGLSSLHKPTPDRDKVSGKLGGEVLSKLCHITAHAGNANVCTGHGGQGTKLSVVRGQGYPSAPGLVPVTLGLRQQYSLTASTPSRHTDWETLREGVGGSGLLFLTNPSKWPLAS